MGGRSSWRWAPRPTAPAASTGSAPSSRRPSASPAAPPSASSTRCTTRRTRRWTSPRSGATRSRARRTSSSGRTPARCTSAGAWPAPCPSTAWTARRTGSLPRKRTNCRAWSSARRISSRSLASWRRSSTWLRWVCASAAPSLIHPDGSSWRWRGRPSRPTSGNSKSVSWRAPPVWMACAFWGCATRADKSTARPRSRWRRTASPPKR
mmetsp:Transcript_75762/g.231907  ORF Transcript_75762/g.231907 Transcript_75762/m.231907 type:complete len:208 (-) Transcript_75762:240-863(-)